MQCGAIQLYAVVSLCAELKYREHFFPYLGLVGPQHLRRLLCEKLCNVEG